MAKREKTGRLEVICGSMFSGKSQELLRRLTRAEIAKVKTCVFKHRLDDRMTIDYIHTHTGDKIKAVALENPEDMHLFISDDVDVIGIDEVQFFAPSVINFIFQLVDQGKRVIVAGLDLDFRGMPFGCIPTLLALADCVTKLTAVCTECGKDAHFTQRLIDNMPAKFTDPVILVGAQECYQARCRECYRIDYKTWQPEQATL